MSMHFLRFCRCIFCLSFRRIALLHWFVCLFVIAQRCMRINTNLHADICPQAYKKNPTRKTRTKPFVEIHFVHICCILFICRTTAHAVIWPIVLLLLQVSKLLHGHVKLYVVQWSHTCLYVRSSRELQIAYTIGIGMNNTVFIHICSLHSLAL